MIVYPEIDRGWGLRIADRRASNCAALYRKYTFDMARTATLDMEVSGSDYAVGIGALATVAMEIAVALAASEASSRQGPFDRGAFERQMRVVMDNVLADLGIEGGSVN